MAHTKAGGSTRQKANRRGKHLGVKIYGGQYVSPGNIILRQRGTEYHAGKNVRLGRDYTIYSIVEGVVKFIKKQGRRVVTVETS